MSDNTAASFLGKTGMAQADFDRVARTPLFVRLPAERLQTLLTEALVKPYRRGEILFFQDEPADRFFFVLDGWVKIFRLTSHGEESVINVFTRGDSFAEAAIFELGTFPVTAQAAEDSRVLAIMATPFLRKLSSEPELCLNIMASMSRHLRSLVSQLEQLTTKSSVQRLAEFLVHMAPYGSGAAEIRLPVDKSLIAGRLGMQPETLSRSLSKLRSVGVDTRQDRVRIDDVATLRDFSQN
ncbi:MAG: Crp/Fnr family transcriptional regulator [Alphaproteobacteria bacterium]|nr:Crp/Fnr family transcriptional regulator [Alphaproteobacteria bacterium]